MPTHGFTRTSSAIPLREIGRATGIGLAELARQIAEFPASLALVGTIYLLALIVSISFKVDSAVLSPIPLCVALSLVGSAAIRASFPAAARLRRGVTAACIIIVLGLSVACLSYLGAMTALPLCDREIIHLDRALGFDWLQAMKLLDRYPAALRILDAAYATFTSQLVLIALVLLAFRRARDFDRFVVTFLCAAIFAEVASVLVPTLGPMAVLAKNTAFVNLPSIGRGTADIVMDLREGTLRTISLRSVDGIITFPSLHAAVAVIVPFACKWNRALLYPIAALDATMFVSAVPSGNHYLIDAIGGLAIALLAIACGHHIERWLNQRISSLFKGLARARVSVDSGAATFETSQSKLTSQPSRTECAGRRNCPEVLGRASVRGQRL